MEIKELLKIATTKLKEADIEEASLKAKITACHFLGMKKEQLILHEADEVCKNDKKKILGAIDRIAKGVPLEHITNTREFMKMHFYVDENVLIPRQDTETLVEEIIKRCNKGKILDLCTGSGVIAISLAKYISNSKVFASDISKKALEIAEKNAKDNNANVSFIQSDMFKDINANDFDFIVSNPPYIETDVINTLQKEVQHEPSIALDGGVDGLRFYRIIAEEAKRYLKSGGMLAVEIGYNQAEAVVNLFKDYRNVEIIKDLSDNDRVVVAFSI